MADNSTNVDVHALGDFHRTLEARLSEVEAVARKLAAIRGQVPALGTFRDGTAYAAYYRDLHADYAARIGRLRTAITAAQAATSTIIANYRQTEDRNHANAAEIAAQLGGVAAALREGPANVG
jgi:hypothetical protein